MTFKEFTKWCNARACDGNWGLHHVLTCTSIYNEIKEIPFWKRERVFKNKYAKHVYEEIVKPINEKIKFKG